MGSQGDAQTIGMEKIKTMAIELMNSWNTLKVAIFKIHKSICFREQDLNLFVIHFQSKIKEYFITGNIQDSKDKSGGKKEDGERAG